MKEQICNECNQQTNPSHSLFFFFLFGGGKCIYAYYLFCVPRRVALQNSYVGLDLRKAIPTKKHHGGGEVVQGAEGHARGALCWLNDASGRLRRSCAQRRRPMTR